MSDANLSTLLKAKELKLVHVATRCCVTKGTVTRWNQRRVPAERVLEVEQVTGISRHDLRPDLYPRDQQEAS